jgi:hypothetical protein
MMTFVITRRRMAALPCGHQHVEIVAYYIDGQPGQPVQYLSRDRMVAALEAETVQAVTEDSSGKRAPIYIRYCHSGVEWLSTRPDGTPTDNLDNLPSF